MVFRRAGGAPAELPFSPVRVLNRVQLTIMRIAGALSEAIELLPYLGEPELEIVSRHQLNHLLAEAGRAAGEIVRKLEPMHASFEEGAAKPTVRELFRLSAEFARLQRWLDAVDVADVGVETTLTATHRALLQENRDLTQVLQWLLDNDDEMNLERVEPRAVDAEDSSSGAR